MFAIQRLRATAVLYEFESGYSRPCVVACEDESGTAAGEYVVKFTPNCRHSDAPLREAAGWAIARHMQLPMPQFAVIDVPKTLLPTVQTESVYRSIANGHGLNVGIKRMPGMRTQLREQRLPTGTSRQAHRIFVLDMLIENWDRTPDNPNVLIGSGGDGPIRIVPIDHESAFAGAHMPSDDDLRWIDVNYHHIVRHLFYSKVKARHLTEVIRDTGIGTIDAIWWARLASELPAEWLGDRLDAIRSLVQRKVDTLQSFLDSIRGILS